MEKTKKISIAGWMISLFLILIPSVVNADLGDILPGFQIYGTVQETYDNNVNLTPKNKKDDFITSIGLGIRYSTLPKSETTGEFQQPSVGEESRYGIVLDFLPGYVFYAKHTSDDYLSLFGNLDTWYTWDKKLTFRVKDYVIRSQEPLEQNYTATALPGQILLGTQRGRATYIRNVVQPSLEYRFGREDILSINYLNNVYRNQNSDFFEDSTENYINPKLTYWIDIRNGISLEYALDLGEFQRSPDMTGNMGKGRYTYRFNPRTSIFGEYAFQSRDFEKQVSRPTTDYDIHAPSIGFEHAFSPTLSLRAQVGYFWQIPKRGSNESGPLYDILITQRAQRTTYTLGFQGGYTEDYYTAENLGFAKYHQVIGTITHQLTQKAAVTFSGRYQRPKYNDGRVDNLWGVGTTASYRILKWLTLGIDFSYAENHSNSDVNDYSDFRGMVRVTATY
ncbi:MAG: outer membrane beta-barrel protein [Thermodesulfobacteriota bacterium]